MSTPVLTKTATLSPHPLLGRLGLLPDLIAREEKKGRVASGENREDHKERAEELGSEYAAVRDSIAQIGVKNPLKICGKYIVDGRHRWLAAIELGIDTLPCIEIKKEDVPQEILASNTRRHLSKQAIALLAVIIYPSVAEETTRGRKKQMGNDYPFTQSDLAKRVGVSQETMKDACAFWREIQLRKSTKEERINQVFAGISFAKALLGKPGEEAKGKPRPAAKPYSLLMRNANSTKMLWKSYADIKAVKARAEIIEAMADAMKEAPEEIREAIQAAWEGGEA